MTYRNTLLSALMALAGFGVCLFGAAGQGEAAQKAALVIGNGAYTSAPALNNPANDARDIAQRLSTLGFDVIIVVDGDHRQMLDALSAFGRAATGAEVALFYYAGHGVQVAGRNWLLPVASDIEVAADLPSQAVKTNDIIDVMEASGASLKLVMLDACRNNPLPKAASRSASRGLARVDAGTAGTMITFATAPGDVAADGNERNSPFTAALLLHIATPGLEIRQLMGRVRETVYTNTSKRQLPWVNEALIGEFYFGGRDPSAPQIPFAKSDTTSTAKSQEPQSDGPSEREAFALAQSINTEGAWDAFLGRYPDGAYAAFAIAARNKLIGGLRTARTSDPGNDVPPPDDAADQTSGFLIPDSDRRPIVPSELDKFSKVELRIARNEIFARRGQFFKSADLNRRFEQFPWYQPYTWSVSLNPVESDNVNLLLQTERSR